MYRRSKFIGSMIPNYVIRFTSDPNLSPKSKYYPSGETNFIWIFKSNKVAKYKFIGLLILNFISNLIQFEFMSQHQNCILQGTGRRRNGFGLKNQSIKVVGYWTDRGKDSQFPKGYGPENRKVKIETSLSFIGADWNFCNRWTSNFILQNGNCSLSLQKSLQTEPDFFTLLRFHTYAKLRI